MRILPRDVIWSEILSGSVCWRSHRDVADAIMNFLDRVMSPDRLQDIPCDIPEYCGACGSLTGEDVKGINQEMNKTVGAQAMHNTCSLDYDLAPPGGILHKVTGIWLLRVDFHHCALLKRRAREVSNVSQSYLVPSVYFGRPARRF